MVTVFQAEPGYLSQDIFRVSGIYSFNIKEMDGGLAFVRLAKAQKMLGIDGGIHEIAIKFASIGIATEKDNPFWPKYSSTATRP